jgi:hypothetical protein
MNTQKQIDLLYSKLQALQKAQAKFNDEIIRLRFQIDKLQQKITPNTATTNTETVVKPILAAENVLTVSQKPKEKISPAKKVYTAKKKSMLKTDLERFIGENLINKIGILILVIGVAIGVKYAINNNIITATARIVLGYIVGFSLLGIAYKLKEKYHAFSAVLLSGAMAILYFITYIAFSFYNLFPQSIAFALMVLFTVFTVIAALNYKEQIIAVLGLVGAYAVPFLLSTGSGNVLVLFSYMVLVNIGILYIAFKQDWKKLYYLAYVFTWLIFISWFTNKYQESIHFKLALSFAFVFYILFYIIFLSYKLIKKEKYEKLDIILLLSNSFIFFGIGYIVLDPNHSAYLGLFTVFNALVNFGVTRLIYTKKLGDKSLFYLLIGLTLVFITAAVPIQLKGNWITLVWLAEAAMLFWLGTSKKLTVFTKLAYPIMILAFFSLVIDWDQVPHYYKDDASRPKIPLFFHINFLTSLLAAVAFGWISYLRFFAKTKENVDLKKWYNKLFTYIIPVLFLLVLYKTFELEIARYWQQIIRETTFTKPKYMRNNSLYAFKTIWLNNYTLFFFSALALLSAKFLKNKTVKTISFVALILTIFSFLTVNLLQFSDLRDNYINQTGVTYYNRGFYHILIRYISYLFLIFGVFSAKNHIKTLIEPKFKDAYTLFIHLIILWVLSSELIQFMALQGFDGIYKFGLSILWGLYALMLVSLGIWKHKKALRVAGIALFSVTLIKLFFYDIVHLNTIAKTIIFMVLGVLLLLISFLYNKYNSKIFENKGPNETIE